MQDKQVRISVEDKKLKELGRFAEEMASESIRNARSLSTSSKEVLRDLEDQIKAKEKLNKLDSENQRTKSRAAFSAGITTRPQLRSELSGIDSADKDNKMTITLLRGIIDEIKTTSKNEIRADRIGVEKTIRKDSGVNKLGTTRDTSLELKRTIQQGLLGDIGEEEATQKGRFKQFGKFGQGAGRTFNTAASIGTSKNALYAGAAILGLTPVIGAGLSQVTNRFLSAGETAESSMSNWGFANMGNKEGFDTEWKKIKKEGTYSDLGISPSDVTNRKAELKKTIGAGFSGDIYETMAAEKFVGKGNTSQLASVSRYGQGDINKVLRVLEAGNKSTTRLTEDIGTYVQASNQALTISSKVDEASLAKTIVGVSKATGLTGRHVGQVSGAIQGMGKTSNPIVKAMMMRAFRKENPNASVFDIQAMMEDPLANFDKGGGRYFEDLKKQTGGGDFYKQSIYSSLNGDVSKSLIKEIFDGGGDIADIVEKTKKVKESDINFKKLATPKIGTGEKHTAIAEAEFQNAGREMLVKAGDTVDGLKNLLDQGKEMYSALTGLSEVVDTASDKVIKAMEGEGLLSTITTGVVVALTTNPLTKNWITPNIMGALGRNEEE